MTGLEAVLSIGVPYDEAVKVTSWNDGSPPTSLDYSGVPASGLELFAPIDLYPRAPFVYGAVILLGSFGFILLEVRRHRR